MAESRNTGQGQLTSETKLKLRIKTRNSRREDDERTCEAQSLIKLEEHLNLL